MAVMKAKGKLEMHNVSVLFLDNNWIEKGIPAWCPLTTKVRIESVKKWLEEILANPQYCSNCGGLKYDFVLDHDGVEYAFALWKITDNSKKGKSKVIAESDYKKLGPYLEKCGKRLPKRKSVSRPS